MHIKTYAEEKKKGARRAQYICDNFDRALVGFLVGNNLVNIGATTIAAYVIGSMIVNPTVANIVNTFGMTIIVLIFGEILPKSFAKEKAETLALRFANILYLLMKILYPIVIIFIGIKKLVFSKVGKSSEKI